MASQGIEELVLVAQETTCYGKDLYGEKRLHVLVRELAKIDGIKWIRLMYCYPEEIYDELIDCFKEEPKLLHYIDMPMQHSEDRSGDWKAAGSSPRYRNPYFPDCRISWRDTGRA